MGSSDIGCDCLQRLDRSFFYCPYLALLALLIFAGSARAQIMPSHATLAYAVSTDQSSKFIAKAANGSAAYALMFLPQRDFKGNIVSIDLVMHRPHAAPNARNLLEPEGRWHGLQDYNFNAIDFVDGPERSIMGPTRTIQIKNRKLSVSFTILKADVAPLTNKSSERDDYIFKELVVDVAIDNLK